MVARQPNAAAYSYVGEVEPFAIKRLATSRIVADLCQCVVIGFEKVSFIVHEQTQENNAN